MKKILALLLAMCCLLTVVSCGNKDDGEVPAGPNGEQIEAIAKIINSSDPTVVVTVTEYSIGEDVYKGRFETERDKKKDKSVFSFSYTRPAYVEEMSDSPVVEVAGKVYYNEGKVSANEGADWQISDSAYVELDMSLDVNKLKSYSVSEDGGTLTATATAENAERILGTKISAEGDVTIVVTTNSVYLYNVRITYTAKSTGASVVVDTSYDYRATNLDFPVDAE